jgi:hypothetical protein
MRAIAIDVDRPVQTLTTVAFSGTTIEAGTVLAYIVFGALIQVRLAPDAVVARARAIARKRCEHVGACAAMQTWRVRAVIDLCLTVLAFVVSACAVAGVSIVAVDANTVLAPVANAVVWLSTRRAEPTRVASTRVHVVAVEARAMSIAGAFLRSARDTIIDHFTLATGVPCVARTLVSGL